MNSKKDSNLNDKVNAMTEDEYILFCWNRLAEYIDEVKNDNIIVCKEIKQIVLNYEADIEDPKWSYNIDKVNDVFAFLYLIYMESRDEGIQRFIIQKWQALFIANVFGFYHRDTDKRRYQRSVVFIGRKNGKSSFSAALILYAMLGDQVQFPQLFLVSPTLDLAETNMRYIRSIITDSPVINEYLETALKVIRIKKKERNGLKQSGESFTKVITKDAKKQDSHKPTFVLFDETHEIGDSEGGAIYDVMRGGSATILNPHIMQITTAGFSMDSMAHEWVMRGHRALFPKEENHEDEKTFYMLFKLDKGDDPEDRTVWIKSNPSKDEIHQPEFLEGEYEDFKKRRRLSKFYTKHLNIFTNESFDWIEPKYIDSLFVDSYDQMPDASTLANMPHFVGMDLSSTQDLTSTLSLYFDEENDHFYVIPRAYMSNNLGNYIRKNGKDLTDWINEGWIHKFDTNTIDNDKVVADIVAADEANGRYTIVSYDPARSSEPINKLQKHKIVCKPFNQWGKIIHPIITKIEDLIFNKKITFINPALNWNFRNVVIKTVDRMGNLKYDKNASLDSIDLFVALCGAIKAYVDRFEPIKKSRGAR